MNMKNDCDYGTSVYKTIDGHKSRKHNPHSLEDFKSSVFQVGVLINCGVDVKGKKDTFFFFLLYVNQFLTVILS